MTREPGEFASGIWLPMRMAWGGRRLKKEGK